ncbi:MAG: hypothetical protein FWF59_08795 [Turicibacter sp.]|nr:hypothetical protein [Turicibacter sp.]
MNKNTLIINHLSQHPIFQKYNEFFELDLMKLLRIDQRIRFFSWGELYLNLRSLQHPTREDDSITVATSIEVFCLAAKILDDMLDGDSSLEHFLNRDNVLLLYTELLTDTFQKLSIHPAFSLAIVHLADSVNGEFNDINLCPISHTFTKQDYVRTVLPKTSSIIKFICTLAGMDETFIDFFAESYGYLLQVKNDLKGIYSHTKNDLKKIRPTLPLIKALDSAQGVKLRTILESPDFLVEDAKQLILASGSLEYYSFRMQDKYELLSKYLNGCYPNASDTANQLLSMLSKGDKL